MAKSAGLLAIILVSSVTMAASAPAFGQEQNVEAAAPEVVVRGRLPDRDSVSRSVYIGDLDLKTPQGVADMEKRVSRAVDWICEIPAVIGYYGKAAERPCRDEGWASARPQMDRAVQLASDGPANR